MLHQYVYFYHHNQLLFLIYQLEIRLKQCGIVNINAAL